MIKIYDIEIYINLFLIVFKEKDVFHEFEISPRKDDRHLLMKYLREKGTFIGFRNVMFDYPVLHKFINLYNRDKNMHGKKIVTTLFNFSQSLIKNDNQWEKVIKKPLLKQVDPYLINHYDNFAKSTSLKMLEFNLEMDDIRVLPYPPDKFLSNAQIDEVIDYCKHDVNATDMFASVNKKAMNFRQRMSKIYNHDFTNYNDVKIGEEILLNEISKQMNINRYDIKQLRTYRKEMKLTDIIFPYIKFDSKEFNVLLSWWKNKIITSTKGQFTKLSLTEVSDLLPYCNTKLEKGKLKNLNLIYKDFQFDFGTGGLHGTCYSDLFLADEKHEILHIDVSSYYPNLAAENKLHPLHIPVNIFVGVIRKMYAQRMNAKSTGDNEMVKAIKLALNGALYGKSNSPFSFMYDPQFMMSICINGQLLLAMLAEKFMDKGFHIIQVNTDGIYVRAERNRRNEINEINKWWMELTKLKLDVESYKLMAQRDVNNYLAIDENDEKKLKGVFDYEYTKNGEYHKNYSMLIIAKALNAYFINGISPDNFVRNHDHLYDFFKRTKFDKNTKLLQREYDNNDNLVNETKLQNITRYYVSTNGHTFVKVMKPLKGKTEDREFIVEVGYKATEANNLKNINEDYIRQSLDYDYYIQKIEENIEKIMFKTNLANSSFELIDDIN